MMYHDPENCPVFFDDPDDVGRLRDVLIAASFTDRGVAEALGIRVARSVSSCDLPQLLGATRGGAPLDTLIRLFLLGVPVDADAAGRAASPMELETWVLSGLIRREGDRVLTNVQLLPFQNLVLAFDLPPRGDTGLKPNYVMGIGASSLTLANLTVRRPSRATLDLGTGCGFQAFLAAPHSDQVVAVDLNARAVSLAAFNARLNGLANVECRQGSFFEPVEGRRFNLIVSNPPFVVSPESHYIYRDSGMQGDSLSRDLARRVPGFLHEGGFCQILCNWVHHAGQDWQTRLAGWFEGTGCDAWVMQSDTLDAAGYASKWIRHTEQDDVEQFAHRYQVWMDYYQRERIEAISGGLITMRRRSGAANWFRADETPERMLGPAGDSILRGFEFRDFIEATRDDRLLLDQRLTVAPELRLQQHLKPAADGWSVVDGQIQLTSGLAYVGEVDLTMVELIGRCDGRRRLGELLRELAIRLGHDPDVMIPPCLPLLRHVIERGFLLPSKEL